MYVSEAVPYSQLDNVAKTVFNGAASVSSKLVQVVAGSAAETPVNKPAPFSRIVASQPMTTNDYNQTIVGQYVQPNSMNAVLIMLTLIFVLLVGLCSAMAVQTPSVLSAETIDWGKIEK